MILAGDIGGTKTVLAFFDKNNGGAPVCIKEQLFYSQEYRTFDEVLATFIAPGDSIDSACFGIAGPVIGQRCQMTNLSWLIDGAMLGVKLGTAKVKLLNDLEAMAIGMLYLPENDWVELNPNAAKQAGNIAVIAAGTGLGEAILYWDGNRHHPIATEGGHCDFAPQNEQQDRLLVYLRSLYPDHVSTERIVSGMGFGHLYDFLLKDGFAPPCPDVPEIKSGIDRNPVISKLGVNGDDALCAEAVRLYVELYGAEAGNLALKSLALGGVFIGGGIAPKILPALKTGGFLHAFLNKGRYSALLEKIPVKLSLNQRTPLLGALHYFSQH